MHMIDHLVRNPSIVLQDIEVFGASRTSDLLGYRQELMKRVVRDVCQFGAMKLWDNELPQMVSHPLAACASPA